MSPREPGKPAVEEVYVLDSWDHLIGLVTRRHLIKQAKQARGVSRMTWADLWQNPHWLPRRKLKEIMKSDPLNTSSNAFLTDAANQMFMQNIR